MWQMRSGICQEADKMEYEKKEKEVDKMEHVEQEKNKEVDEMKVEEMKMKEEEEKKEEEMEEMSMEEIEERIAEIEEYERDYMKKMKRIKRAKKIRMKDLYDEIPHTRNGIDTYDLVEEMFAGGRAMLRYAEAEIMRRYATDKQKMKRMLDLLDQVELDPDCFYKEYNDISYDCIYVTPDNVVYEIELETDITEEEMKEMKEILEKVYQTKTFIIGYGGQWIIYNDRGEIKEKEVRDFVWNVD